MAALPTGTVTFLFTDIEGSTALLQRLGDRRYAEILDEHRRLLRDAFEEGNGREIDTQGDAFLVAFSRARDAVATAVVAQRALMKHPWPDGASLQVRMGLHTGEPISNADRYVGLDVHRAARIGAAGHGGQILLSDAVSGLVARDLPPGVSLRDLRTHRLKDLKEPEHLFQVIHPDLGVNFPPLKSLDVLPNNLPRQLTSFIGRDREMAEVKTLLATTSLLTLTGAGGSGKTRLALQVATDLLEHYPDGVWLAQLAPLSEPTLIPKAVASAVGIPEQPGRPLTEAVLHYLQPRTPLLLLDNCEHLLEACAQLADALLQACPNLRILATGREPLGITGELTYRVPSLSLPDLKRLPSLETLTQYEAVRLFVERAAFSKPGFRITTSNAAGVAKVTHRLDGIPLAIELAAARVKALPVDVIATRLDDQFRLLTGGSRTGLPRHQTLRATLDWSYNLLSEDERTLLRRLSDARVKSPVATSLGPVK
jgi:class 3 adenylate cyclase